MSNDDFRPKVASEEEEENRIIQDGYLQTVADLLIDHITDYFTLGKLARTCKAFQNAVKARPRVRNQLFDQIEKTERNVHPRHDYLNYSDGGHWVTLCDKIQEELTRPWYFDLSVYVTSAGRKMRMINDQLSSTDLSLWGGFSYREVLDANVLPCYGCKKFKHRSYFFQHHKTDHLVLLGCEHGQRRCADCAVTSMSTEKDPITNTMLGIGKRFLVDMPKGFAGYREWCQVCSRSRWVRQRPKKTREVKQVCEECFAAGLSAAKVRQPDLRKQRSLQRERQTPAQEDFSEGESQGSSMGLSVEIASKGRRLSFQSLTLDPAS